ncbi:MAG: hypothetical protein FJ088_03860 [Deltaproteobacteria bacterium]|nr:hypothetical protein [Deltaproteobacteria bacterium]
MRKILVFHFLLLFAVSCGNGGKSEADAAGKDVLFSEIQTTDGQDAIPEPDGNDVQANETAQDTGKEAAIEDTD